MIRRVIRIEWISSRKGVTEEPEVTAEGCKLGDPRFGDRKHPAQNAVHVRTLEEAAVLIGKGFSLWMGARGKPASLIASGSLRILWSGGDVAV